MEIIFIQLAIILLTAFIVSYIIRTLKQPVILGYIITGIIISPFILKFGASQDVTHFFSKLGIAFLLFVVGLHMNPKVIKEIGLSALIIGLVQMAITFLLSFAFTTYALKFNTMTSTYVGIALAFSSTIIILKFLSDQKELESLYGKISIGILIIQDVAAIAVLMVISSTSGPGAVVGSFAFSGLIKAVGLIILLFAIGFTVLPYLVRSVAKHQELLFLFSIMWAFTIGALFNYLGFSIEIGALIAGIVLSISPFSTEISSKIRPLRDFFLIIFFIILGLNIQISSISSIIVNAIILSIFALFFKTLITMSLMASAGYTKRTNFFVGITLSQISEFSLIILALGVSLGQIPADILSTLTLTAIITIAVSTYMMIYAPKLYKKMYNFITFFERDGIKKEAKVKKEYDAILFGYNRIGFSILESLKRMKKSYLVVDFNPDTIVALKKMGIPALYGDVDDEALLEELPLEKVQLAISTIPEVETSEVLLNAIKSENPKAIVILRAHTIEDAMRLYKAKADYVLTPHFLGGQYLADMIKEIKTDSDGYKKEKDKHIKMLLERFSKGQEHPAVEKN